MNAFRKLFAVSPQEIKEDVIITPFLSPEYFNKDAKNKIKKGFLFETLNGDGFSVVKTGVGASFVGDALIYLKQTKAKRVYFIGSCGAVSGLNIGDLVLVRQALNLESFSGVLKRSVGSVFLNAENALYKKFLKLDRGIREVKLATVGSLSLQKSILPLLKNRAIDVVDMEVSAFISAVRFLKFSHLALLYVTDNVQGRLFCRKLTPAERLSIKKSRHKAVSLICDFITRQNASRKLS
jgi:purine-nucleoside phosphorylase